MTWPKNFPLYLIIFAIAFLAFEVAYIYWYFANVHECNCYDSTTYEGLNNVLHYYWTTNPSCNNACHDQGWKSEDDIIKEGLN